MKQKAALGVLLTMLLVAAGLVWRSRAPSTVSTMNPDAGLPTSPVALVAPRPTPRVACEPDGGLSPVEALFEAQVDTPRGELRSGPARECGLLLSLEDAASVEVLDDTLNDAGWLRVRVPGVAEGWVEAPDIANVVSEVQTQGDLMLRSRTTTFGMQDTTRFSVFLERDGGWQRYESIFGTPFIPPTDFLATAALVDLDNDGDTDLVFSEYCCGRGYVNVVCSTDAGALVQIATFGGSEFEENEELDLPRLGAGSRSVTMGAVTVDLSCTPEPESAPCPAGMKFVRGGHFRRAQTREGVLVSGFCMDVTEVTVAAYARKAQSPAATGVGCNGNKADRGEDPANCVTWSNASDYCELVGKRLPTDDEWEWASRGLHLGKSMGVCWNGEGNDLGKGQRTRTCRAGSFEADTSAAGIRDLAGNVAEWTSSRATRGSSWADTEPAFEDRAESGEDEGFPDLGFRCVSRPVP